MKIFVDNDVIYKNKFTSGMKFARIIMTRFIKRFIIFMRFIIFFILKN